MHGHTERAAGDGTDDSHRHCLKQINADRGVDRMRRDIATLRRCESSVGGARELRSQLRPRQGGAR